MITFVIGGVGEQEAGVVMLRIWWLSTMKRLMARRGDFLITLHENSRRKSMPRGVYVKSPEHLANLAASNRRRYQENPELREKARESALKHYASPAGDVQRALVSAALTGIKRSEETRRKVGLNNPKRNSIEKFWEKVSKSDHCWEFMGRRDDAGYGHITIAGVKGTLAHRIAWALANGDIPPGIDVLHRCDNPPCCNPDHLFLGTALDNVVDMVSKGRFSGRLGSQDVLTMRALFGRKLKTLTEIGRMFGMRCSAVKRIVEYDRWKHVS